jgi:hypothetical protein
MGCKNTARRSRILTNHDLIHGDTYARPPRLQLRPPENGGEEEEPYPAPDLAKNQRTTPNLHKEEKWHKAKPKSNPNYCCAEGGTLTFSSLAATGEERGGASI